MSFKKKLKAIIKEERYTQKQFAEMVDIPLSSLEKYLLGKSDPSYKVLVKIVTHPNFSKYTMWLMGGEVQPNSGQVCPDISTQEQCGLLKKESEKRA
ncbi:helix-turn-helix domain-containing protein [Photobacterium damselae subsp. damselae]|uniref:helix-turn-helix domain-containing protein n=1 Tax=Photobacterium damselae TaxID=38293 RepID=UPI001F435710|nr:helix-turn-helix transcriptional regulator [Photobacterium damselae]UKA08847.1 helix-turn-helix domain-containing protein [Photobacterium damselae subsp. damselae]UKA23950.1 helix-turn-helix domain-containing protein [Photobacterium damselae subsp. damselae]